MRKTGGIRDADPKDKGLEKGVHMDCAVRDP
jgi:hypothetical protein